MAAPEGKKGGKGAAKGGKSQDETLREELDLIKSVQQRGWILLDFPRNLTQMKLLETALSGYESKADLPKDENREKYEAWSKIATPSCLVSEDDTGAFTAETSGLDGVIILNTPSQECERRASNRKIDPTTQ